MFYVKRKHLICILLLSLNAISSGAVTLTASAQSGGDVCFGDVVQLTCSTGRDKTEYLATGLTFWLENDIEIGNMNASAPQYSSQSSNRSLLTVNFTREHFQERTNYSYQCYYIFRNTSLDESGVVGIVTGPARPSTPSLLGPVNITESAAVLSLSPHTGHKCFEDCSFRFDVTLTSTVLGSQATFTSNTSRVVLSGLKAAYSYRADITSVCSGGGGQLGNRSEPLVVELFVGPGTTEPGTTEKIVAGVVAFVVIILVLLVAILLVVMVMYRRRKSTPPPTQPSRGEVPSYQNSREEVSYQAVKYAELDFGKPSERPIKPPPLETVIYTEAGGTIALPKEEKPPKVPEKKKNMVATGKGAFVKDVLAVMDGTGVLLLADNGSCIRDDCSEGKCDHKKLQAFRADAVARYKDITFAANCLEEPGVEVSKKDVQRIIAIRKGLDVDKALLICNQEFMSMDLLIDLEKERCFFVPTANHGKEGWDNTFLSKFTALFA